MNVVVAKASAPHVRLSVSPANASELLTVVAHSHRFGPGTLEDGDSLVASAHALKEGALLLWYPRPGKGG